jgi:hypothetical protein
MKSISCLLFLAVLTAARAHTVATPGEVHVRADVDGDGRADLTVINRADGSFRIGYQTVPGTLSWAASRASGAPGAAWATVGNLTGQPAALAISAPVSNLVSIVAAPAANSAVVPITVAATGIGPAGVLATDIGGAGNTPADDLLVFTSLNDLPTPAVIELVRHTGGGESSFSPLAQAAGQTFRAADRVVAKDGGPRYAAHLAGAENAATFRLNNLTTGGLVSQAEVAGVPGSGFVAGKFGGGAFHHFFFWQTGETAITWRPAAALGPDGVQFLAGGSFPTGRPIGQVLVLTGGVANRLLVIAEDETSAAVYDFDGVAATLVRELPVTPGVAFTGAAELVGGGFSLLGGQPGTGLSSQWQNWLPSGADYVAGASGLLPGYRPAGTRANVFLFATEPFATADPGWLASLNAPEWSSGIQFAGNPAAISATAEIYLNEVTGLSSAAAHPLGTAPAGAAHALANQIRSDLSLASLSAILGPAGLSVTISPAPGVYHTAVTPVLHGTPTGVQMYARLGNGPWTPAADFKPRLTDTAVVQYYAQLPGSLRKTPVGSATYTFSVAPNLIDSDLDGVPDFVEATAAPNPPLDPNSGADVDEDGYSDLEEWLAGTEPLVETSHPAQHVSHGGSFTVRGTPRPLDGTTGSRTVAATGVLGEITTPGGASVATGVTQLGVPGLLQPSWNITGLSSDSTLAAVLSQPVFDIATAAVNPSRGRELAMLFPVPRPPIPKVNYVPAGGTTEAEVAAWKAAALAAQNASQPVIVSVEPTEHHVLTALLFERWLNETAVARELSGVTATNLTIFPTRPGEASQRALTPQEFGDLKRRLSDTQPGWDPVGVLAALRAATVPPGIPALAELRALATDLWRISSLLGVDADAADYLPPLDVLRGFIRTGQLPGAYLTATLVSEAARTAAFASIAPLLAGLASRPVATLDLEVSPQSFAGPGPVLDRIGMAGQVSLMATAGVPFVFPESFTLMPGSRVRVTGHPDLVDPDYPGDELEVLSLSVIYLPTPVAQDLDNNLLADAWDCYFFAGDGDPMADSDGDGFSNLQELLDGTDPQLAESKGVLPVDLSPPPLAIKLIDGDQLLIEWDYPAAYAGLLEFAMEFSDQLNQFQPLAVVPQQVNGHHTVTLPLPNTPTKFYRAVLRLAD